MDSNETRPIMTTSTIRIASPATGLAEAEDIVKTIWREALGDDSPREIGAEDDFFEIGGTSLSLIAVVSKMSERFGTELPTGIVVNGATVSALAKSALEALAAAEVLSPVQPVAARAA